MRLKMDLEKFVKIVRICLEIFIVTFMDVFGALRNLIKYDTSPFVHWSLYM